MRYLNIILLLISFNMSAQEWITDNNFDNQLGSLIVSTILWRKNSIMPLMNMIYQ